MTVPLFQGSLVALVTPFTAKGRIDVKALQALVRWHLQEGTEGIICTGTTGEAAVLSESERKKVLQVCLEAAEKKIPILSGTGTCDTKQTVRLTEGAARLGADGCLVITPYYNKPTPRGCLLHFQEVASVGLPFVVYNNPGRTAIQLQPETIAELAKLPYIAGLKESTHDPSFLRKIRALTTLPILAGEDDLTFEMLEEGAVGSISVVGNVIPQLWKEMIQLARMGHWNEARERSQLALPLCHALFLETNPQCVKAALLMMGKCKAHLRLPLVEPTEQVLQEIRSAMLRLALPYHLPCAKSV
jgi:4-hydroxy-tetrahydrodipicolinate synthase